MNDEDADIERMLTNYRNRKRLGFSYYLTTGHSTAAPDDGVTKRRAATARQKASRDRQKALRAEPAP